MTTKALISLLLLCCLFSIGWSQCENFTPDFPKVVSPVLESSIPPTRSPDFTIFTWNRPDMGKCADIVDELYEVMISQDSNIPLNGLPICSVEKASSCFITDFSQLDDGKEYRWSVKLTLNMTTNRAIMDTSEIDLGFFTWCEPAAPIEPTLTGPSNNFTFKYLEEVVLTWTPLSPQNFGKSCNGTANVINVYISKSSTSLDGYVFSRPDKSSSYTYAPLLNGALEPGVWYWSIEASNSLSGTTSVVNYFNVLPPDPIPCVPDCVNGLCNTTKGECICSNGYKGKSCSEAILTPTDAPTEPPSDPIPLIVGLVVAAFVVILVIGFLVFFYMREKKKREQFEMTTILIEPPDFPTLAFQPYSIVPSPFGDSVAKKSSWKSFEQLLLSEDYGLVFAILSSARMVHLDNLCTWLVVVFENNKAGSNLIQTLMLKELEDFEGQKDVNANHESNPMPYRGDSAATKAFKVYTRIVGLPYLFETLGQILNDFCALLDEAEKNKENEVDSNKDTSVPSSGGGGQSSASLRPAFNQMSMEVDPKRMNSEDDETINRLSLQLICQKLFVKIFRSVDIFPTQIRVLCKRIRDESKKKESLQGINLNVLLSNLIFLRFINPAILVPHQCGIVKDEPTKGTQRQLVLITKVLQNLAANVEFGKKEAFMTKLNDFIRANFGQMNNFLSSLTENIDTNATGLASYSAPISVSVVNSSFAGLYEYVYNNQDLVLASVQRVVSTRKAAQIEESLQSILREIGDPATYKK